MARAAFADRVDVKFSVKGSQDGADVVRVNGAQETVMQQIVIGPGGHTGWHSHPGPVVVLVKSGELTFYSGDDPTCTGRTYSAGEAFIDSGQGHVHVARNLSSSQNTELWATYFDVPPGGAFRLDAAAPGTVHFDRRGPDSLIEVGAPEFSATAPVRRTRLKAPPAATERTRLRSA
jgi:quercetin dioxygenase-like cupin family protein